MKAPEKCRKIHNERGFSWEEHRTKWDYFSCEPFLITKGLQAVGQCGEVANLKGLFPTQEKQLPYAAFLQAAKSCSPKQTQTQFTGQTSIVHDLRYDSTMWLVHYLPRTKSLVTRLKFIPIVPFGWSDPCCKTVRKGHQLNPLLMNDCSWSPDKLFTNHGVRQQTSTNSHQAAYSIFTEESPCRANRAWSMVETDSSSCVCWSSLEHLGRRSGPGNWSWSDPGACSR